MAVEGIFDCTSPQVKIALDTVAATLEKDLEDERRERKEQVGFLNRICLKERELLIGRAESFQRQLAEAQELWEKERVIFQEKLSVSEAALVAATCGTSPVDTLRLELNASNKESFQLRAEMKELHQEAQTCQAQRDTAASSLQEIQSRHASRDLEVVSRMRVEYAECRQACLEEAASEVRSLRQQLQTVMQEKDGAERDAEAKVLKARESEEQLAAKIRSEHEEEHESAIMRAVWQLKVADDCVVSLQGRLEQEAEARTALQTELLASRQEFTEEVASSRRLALALSTSENEQHFLAQKVQVLETSLRGDLSKSPFGASDMPDTSQERQQAAQALIQRVRARQAASEPLQEPLTVTPSAYDALWPKTGSVGSSPLRSSPHLRGASSFLSSLGLAASPSKDVSISGVTALGLR